MVIKSSALIIFLLYYFQIMYAIHCSLELVDELYIESEYAYVFVDMHARAFVCVCVCVCVCVKEGYWIHMGKYMLILWCNNFVANSSILIYSDVWKKKTKVL